jgi:hypothetical protein
MTPEEREWRAYYRFEVRDDQGVMLDSDLIKGKRGAISRAKISYERQEGKVWFVYNLENEVVDSSTSP